MRTMSVPTTEKGVQGMWDVVVQKDCDMELAMLVHYKSLNDPSLLGLKSKRKKLKLIWNTTVYKERKSKEQQGKKEVAEKELTCVCVQ